MSEITLEAFLNHLSDAVVVVGPKGEILRQNALFQSLFPNKSVSLIDLLSGTPVIKDQLAKIFTEGGTYSLRDVPIPSSIGEIKADVDVFPMAGAQGETVALSFWFRLGRSALHFDEHQKRMDRLQYLATIASGLAHEIRNPLSGIKGASQLLRDSLQDQKELGEYAEIIQQEVVRVDKLVKELLHFSKPRTLSKKETNVNRILHDSVLLERTVEPERIQIIEEFDPSLPPVWADPEALTQVFLNLLKNARQAIKGPGRILVRSRIVMDFTLKKGAKRRQMLSVDIEDNGPGIDPENLTNIFVPFFTTKAKGTGLGLALCHQLVEEHEGDMRVKTEPGKGSTFSVYLPF